MYFRRWTRMHIGPAIKYLDKYGVIDPKYGKIVRMMGIENTGPDHHLPKPHRSRYPKDQETKLINRLFLKYPDLQYEPISHAKYPGKKVNTFSYAYAFISEQKKMMKQGYSEQEAFKLVEQKYQEQMRRKMDQLLISRELALGNRAKSFLSIYQQQAHYESQLKMLRTKRELEKYELKLQKIRKQVESKEDPILDYEREFVKIVDEDAQKEESTVKRQEGQEKRKEFIQRIQKKFQNTFHQYYQRIKGMDRLEGLADETILNEINASPNKIKRKTRGLLKGLQNYNVTIDAEGKVTANTTNQSLKKFLENSQQIKIALLNQKLNFQKPAIGVPQEKERRLNDLRRAKSNLINQPISKDEKVSIQKKIKQNKQKDYELAINQKLEPISASYKIFQSPEERMLRLQIIYLHQQINKMKEEEKRRRQEEGIKEEAQKDIEGQKGEINNDAQLIKEKENKLQNLIRHFKRIKFRLEKELRDKTLDDFIFEEHRTLDGLDELENNGTYEDLISHLRKKAEVRKLTALDQANNYLIEKELREKEFPQAPKIPQTYTSQ